MGSTKANKGRSREVNMDRWLDITIRVTVRGDVEDVVALASELAATLTRHDQQGALVFNPDVLQVEEATP
jgi:hypothetical protein